MQAPTVPRLLQNHTLPFGTSAASIRLPYICYTLDPDVPNQSINGPTSVLQSHPSNQPPDQPTTTQDGVESIMTAFLGSRKELEHRRHLQQRLGALAPVIEQARLQQGATQHATWQGGNAGGSPATRAVGMWRAAQRAVSSLRGGSQSQLSQALPPAVAAASSVTGTRLVAAASSVTGTRLVGLKMGPMASSSNAAVLRTVIAMGGPSSPSSSVAMSAGVVQQQRSATAAANSRPTAANSSQQLLSGSSAAGSVMSAAASTFASTTAAASAVSVAGAARVGAAIGSVTAAEPEATGTPTSKMGGGVRSRGYP